MKERDRMDPCWDHRAEAILAWMNCFDAVEGLIDISDLYDSAMLGKVLTEMDPFFSDLQYVLVAGEDISWTEKASNLDKIKLALTTYYSRILRKGFKVEDDIDTSAIAKGRGFADFINLMELVCGVGVMCTNHTHFDQQILKLSPESQLFLQELRENIGINTYDLIDIKDDMSDISNGSDTVSDSDFNAYSDDDANGNCSFPLSPNNAKGKDQQGSLLQRHLQTTATLEIQKNIIREYEAEKNHHLQLITSLREENSSLQAEAHTQSTQAMTLTEQARALQASNDTSVYPITLLCSPKHHIQHDRRGKGI